MTSRSLRLVCVAALALSPLTAPAVTNTPAATTTEQSTNTPPSPELQKTLSDALEAFGKEHYDEAIAKLTAAEKLVPNDPEIINMEGAIYVKEEKWQQANDAFNRSLQINPKYFPASFNLAEVIYLQKKYPEARAAFEKLAADQPKNELVQYKIYLTYLMEGNLTEAKAKLDKFDFSGNTPAYYYAQAAWYFKQGDPAQAQSYVGSALQIFPAQPNNIFAESLIDAGWLKRKAPATDAKK